MQAYSCSMKKILRTEQIIFDSDEFFRLNPNYCPSAERKPENGDANGG